MSSPHYLTLDVGTQSVRACLIDDSGSIVTKAQLAFAAPQSLQPGYAEFPAESFWHSSIEVIKEVSRYAHQNDLMIAAIGVTTQRASVVALDQHGEPLRPVLLWSDQRKCEPPDSLGLIGMGMKLIGVHDTVKQFQSDAEINYLAANEPEVWRKTEKLVFLSGYINYRLTGSYVDSIASQVGYVPFDYRKQAWCEDGKWHWKALPAVKRRHLPTLTTPGTVLGHLTKSTGAELGLPAGLPVVACATDKACEVLGTGCLQVDQACLSFGTAATVNVTSSTYKEVDRFVPAYPAALPNHYLCEEQIYRGFWLVNWFKQEFAASEREKAAQRGIAAETLFDEFLDSTSLGANGLIALPYWSPGVRVPGPEARGALIGFNDSHTRAHVYRAIIEGLVFAMRSGIEKIARRTNQQISQVRVAGGGSQSDAIVQLTANVLGRNIQRAHTYEASSLGAAICCAVALDPTRSFESAVQSMTRPGKSFQPDPTQVSRYNDLYSNVYQKMYPRLKPLYHAIADH